MDAIGKRQFAERIVMSAGSLRKYLKRYKPELSRLGQEGNSLNYKAVLFLCWKIVVDPIEVYTKENRDYLLAEQCKILKSLYGEDKTTW